jgi:hypothetical protein
VQDINVDGGVFGKERVSFQLKNFIIAPRLLVYAEPHPQPPSSATV